MPKGCVYFASWGCVYFASWGETKYWVLCGRIRTGSDLWFSKILQIRTSSDSTFADQDWTRTEKFHSPLISGAWTDFWFFRSGLRLFPTGSGVWNRIRIGFCFYWINVIGCLLDLHLPEVSMDRIVYPAGYLRFFQIRIGIGYLLLKKIGSGQDHHISLISILSVCAALITINDNSCYFI